MYQDLEVLEEKRTVGRATGFSPAYGECFTALVVIRW